MKKNYDVEAVKYFEALRKKKNELFKTRFDKFLDSFFINVFFISVFIALGFQFWLMGTVIYEGVTKPIIFFCLIINFLLIMYFGSSFFKFMSEESHD